MFPADAGMNRWEEDFGEYRDHVPRRRGDEPGMANLAIFQTKCSPQTRG